jgi:hypothetical protein
MKKMNNELKNRHLRIDTNSKVTEEQSVPLNINKGGQKDELGGQKDELGGQKKWSDCSTSLSKNRTLREKNWRKH